jgi:GAF domain-containing protein
MNILIENAGAQQGCLMSPREGNLVIDAQGSIARKVAITQKSTPVTEATTLPITVINYVAITHSDVVLSDAANMGAFTQDEYIQKQQLKSLLCTPIIKGGELIAILYLENNLTRGAFTPERLEILRILSAQAAIALENARLYASVEQKVEQRTQELNEFPEIVAA